MGPQDAIKDVPIPALVMGAGILCAFALCVMLVRKREARASAFEKWGGVVGAWCALIGFVVAHHRIVGRGYLSPTFKMATEHWLPWIGLLAALLATARVLWRAPLWARVVANAGLGAAGAAAILIPLMRSEYLDWFVWSTRDAGVWFVGGALGIAWMMACLSLLATRAPAWSAWLTMSAVLGVIAPSLAFWGVAQDARLMGVLSAMCGVVCVVCALTKRKSFGRPVALVMGAMAGALVLHAAVNGDGLHLGSLALVLLAPIVWVAAEWGLVRKKLGKWGVYALRVLLPVTAGVIAAWLAFVPDEYSGLGY